MNGWVDGEGVLHEEYWKGQMYGVRYLPPRAFVLNGCVLVETGWFFPRCWEDESVCYIDIFISSSGYEIVLDYGYNKFCLWSEKFKEDE